VYKKARIYSLFGLFVFIRFEDWALFGSPLLRKIEHFPNSSQIPPCLIFLCRRI